MPHPDPASLRVSHAEREAVVAQLRQSLDAGRIDLGEFDERTRDVYDAATYDELNRVLGDLPGAELVAPPQSATAKPPPPQPPPPPGPKQNGMGTAALVCGALSVVNFFPFSILAIILGAIGVDRARKGRADNMQSAVIGLVLGSVSLPVWITLVTLGSIFWWG